jgi:hypothetical protein
MKVVSEGHGHVGFSNNKRFRDFSFIPSEEGGAVENGLQVINIKVAIIHQTTNKGCWAVLLPCTHQ